MAGKRGQLVAGCRVWCLLHKLAHGCNKTRQRRTVWLGCLCVAAVIVVYLPLIFHTSTAPVGAFRRAGARRNTVHSTQIVFTEVDSSLLEKFSMDQIFAYKHAHFSRMFANISEEDDVYLHSLCEASRREESVGGYESVTLIFSLYNILTDMEAIYHIRQHLLRVPGSFTDDVIITAQNDLPKTFKDIVEEFVDLCQVCRLLFLSGNIYKHWNDAAKFARNKYVLFIDGRVTLTKNSLQTMMKYLQSHKNVVVSPQVRLKYAGRRGHNVGLSRNEITWDLGVSRGPVSYQLLRTAQRSGTSCVNQTVISKEVFGINKQMFDDLGGFDTIPDITGGEHVSFSLKVLNCHGNIVTSLCSAVYLSMFNTPKSTYPRAITDYSAPVDFHNPSFDATHTNVSAYYIAASRPWLDAYTTQYYTCSLGRRIPSTDSSETLYFGKLNPEETATSYRPRYDLKRYLTSRYGYYGYSLKQRLIKSRCAVGNFRYIISQRQPNMLPPTRAATFYGYIRTIDGMYAFGRPTETSLYQAKVQSSRAKSGKDAFRPTELDNFILTRNTSLWVGPFSFTNGAFIYNNVWCVTVSTRFAVTLRKCVKGEENQLFAVSNNTITLLGMPERCVGARRTSEISSQISLLPCSRPDNLRHFKLDVEFSKRCVK